VRLPSLALSALLLAAAATPALAGPATDTFRRCLAEHASAADRKQLARWMWLSMGEHAEAKAVAPLQPELRARADAAIGQLVTRLMADDCAAEMRSAVGMDGAVAIRSASSALGQLALRELLSDPAVQKSIEAFTESMDDKRLDQALKPR
jgi:hypothetical protein